MSEPGLGCWVLAQSLAWSRGSQTPLARIPVLGARRICHLPAASFWAAHITSWSLLWEADWWGSWKDDINQRKWCLVSRKDCGDIPRRRMNRSSGAPC